MPRMKLVRLLGATTLAASMLGTLSAQAQEPSKPAPAGAAASASAATSDEAKKQFDAGVSYLEDPDGAKYEDAYRSHPRSSVTSASARCTSSATARPSTHTPRTFAT